MAGTQALTATEVYENAERLDPGVEAQSRETAAVAAAKTFQTQLEMGEITKSEYDALMVWLKRISAAVARV